MTGPSSDLIRCTHIWPMQSLVCLCWQFCSFFNLVCVNSHVSPKWIHDFDLSALMMLHTVWLSKIQTCLLCLQVARKGQGQRNMEEGVRRQGCQVSLTQWHSVFFLRDDSRLTNFEMRMKLSSDRWQPLLRRTRRWSDPCMPRAAR